MIVWFHLMLVGFLHNYVRWWLVQWYAHSTTFDSLHMKCSSAQRNTSISLTDKDFYYLESRLPGLHMKTINVCAVTYDLSFCTYHFYASLKEKEVMCWQFIWLPYLYLNGQFFSRWHMPEDLFSNGTNQVSSLAYFSLYDLIIFML